MKVSIYTTARALTPVFSTIVMPGSRLADEAAALLHVWSQVRVPHKLRSCRRSALNALCCPTWLGQQMHLLIDKPRVKLIMSPPWRGGLSNEVSVSPKSPHHSMLCICVANAVPISNAIHSVASKPASPAVRGSFMHILLPKGPQADVSTLACYDLRNHSTNSSKTACVRDLARATRWAIEGVPWTI